MNTATRIAAGVIAAATLTLTATPYAVAGEDVKPPATPVSCEIERDTLASDVRFLTVKLTESMTLAQDRAEQIDVLEETVTRQRSTIARLRAKLAASR